MNETAKSVIRRMGDIRFATRYYVGEGIDIGSGNDSLEKYKNLFPLATSIRSWDHSDGDAQMMKSIADNTFQFVNSSHCLEHLINPYIGFGNWIRICKPDGHIICTIPDEDLYEQGHFPSIFNFDHKKTFTINKKQSWNEHSINIFDFLDFFSNQIQILKVELLDSGFIYNTHTYDQTYQSISESAIEIIIRKLNVTDMNRRGRLPL